MALEKTILKHQDTFSKFLDIKITSNDIIEKINAFDWLDLLESKNEYQFQLIIFTIFEQFNFKYKPKYDVIIKKEFSELFVEAVGNIKESITAVSHSYNIAEVKEGFRNAVVDKFHYIEYWASKKNIPVNYNEKDQSKRELFNLDTILVTILSDKLKNFNNYELNNKK